MALTWKDAVATLLVGATAAVAYARIKGFDWPLLTSWRMGSLALLIIGLGSCIVIGSGTAPAKNGWTVAATVLGVTAFILALVGVVADSKLAFLALAANIIVLWVISTLHHALASGN